MHSSAIRNNCVSPVFIIQIKIKANLANAFQHTSLGLVEILLLPTLLTPQLCPLFTLSACIICQQVIVTHSDYKITLKPLVKITKMHSNHCDSTARGNVKTPFLPLLSPCTASLGLASLIPPSFDLSFIPSYSPKKAQVGGLSPA